jgi:outer membrane protein TolC
MSKQNANQNTFLTSIFSIFIILFCSQIIIEKSLASTISKNKITTQIISLKILQSHAHQRRLEIKNLKLKIKIAEEQKSKAWKDYYLPRLDFKTAARYQQIHPGLLPKKYVSETTRADNTDYQATLSVSQNLFSGWEDQANFNIAELRLQKQYLQLKDATNKLDMEVNNDWLDYQALLIQYKIYLHAVERDKKIDKKYQRQFRNGLLSKSQWNRQHLNYIENQLQLQTLDQQLTNSKIRLLNLAQISGPISTSAKNNINRFSEKQIPLADLEKKFNEWFTSWTQSNYKTISLALKEKFKLNSPLWKQSSIDNKISEHSQTRSLAKYRPKLTLGADWNFNSLSAENQKPTDPITAKLSFNYPIFSSLDKKYDHEVLIRETEITANKQQILLRDSNREIESKTNDLIFQHSQYLLIKEKAAARQKLFKEISKSYKNGAVKLRNYLEDLDRARQSKLQLSRSAIKIQKTINELNYLTGSVQKI